MTTVRTPSYEWLPTALLLLSPLCLALEAATLQIPSLANAATSSTQLLNVLIAAGIFGAPLLAAPAFLFIYKKVLSPVFWLGWAALVLSALTSPVLVVGTILQCLGVQKTCSASQNHLINSLGQVSWILLLAGLVLLLVQAFSLRLVPVRLANKVAYVLSLLFYAGVIFTFMQTVWI
jgi:hypothetical protein